MSSSYVFLATPDEAQFVCEWFRRLEPAPVELRTENGRVFFFRHIFHIASVNSKSALVNVVMPTVRRGNLTTAGEVQFLTTPIRLFPEIRRINRAFRKWISQYLCDYGPVMEGEEPYPCRLEGSLPVATAELFVFPCALQALKSGACFVCHGDSEECLNDVRARLRPEGRGNGT